MRSECIACEIRVDRQEIFFTVSYRSPSNRADSINFHKFLCDFHTLVTKIKDEKPHAMLFPEDFNSHCQNCYANGETNEEGLIIDDVTYSLHLNQSISEPTNSEENRNPTCIDLIFTDQPNIIMESSGTRPSLDNYCKHQIISCLLNLRMPPAPPYERERDDIMTGLMRYIFKELLIHFPGLSIMQMLTLAGK